MEFNLDELKMIRRALCDLSSLYENKAEEYKTDYWQAREDQCEDIIEKVTQEIMKLKYGRTE